MGAIMSERCIHCRLPVTRLGVLVHDVAGVAHRMHGACPRLYRALWAASKTHTSPELAPLTAVTPPAKHVAINES